MKNCMYAQLPGERPCQSPTQPQRALITRKPPKCSNWKDCNSVAHKHCVKGWRNLVRLWRAQKLCDVTITVKGETFRCHAIVPASVSPFFRNVFVKRQNMSAETAMVCEKEVIVDFMDPELFAQILHFMYTAEIRFKPENARPLILAAGRLEMQSMVNAIMQQILDWEIARMECGELRQSNVKGFKNVCVKRYLSERQRQPHYQNQKVRDAYIQRHKKEDSNKICKEKNCCGDMSEDESTESNDPGMCHGWKYPRDKNLTVTGIMDELRLQGDLVTMKNVQTFAVRHFSKILELDSFLEASVHTMACLLDDERLNIDELHVFLALCRWLEASQMHLVHAPYLLSKVRLQLLSPSQLAEHVETKEYLMRKKKCRVNILEAFRFHCLLTQTGNTPDDTYTLEAPKGQKPRIGTKPDYETDQDDFSCDEDGCIVRKDKNSVYCPIKPCACCPDYILASGGIDTKEKAACDAVYKYEEKENAWFRFARMPQPRNHHSAVYGKGALYILGGSDPSLTGPGAEVCPVSTCHRLGLGSLKWCKIESMSIPRMSLQGAYLNGHIYAVGGQDHKQRILRDAERYSLEAGIWEHAGDLSCARAGIAVCRYDDRLWAMGGYCHKSGIVLDTVEAYDEEYGDWEVMPALRFPRCFANAAVSNHHLYVLGGAWLDSEMECSNFSSVYDVDIYNPASKVWEGITALRIGRHDAGVAVLGPRIYIIGGKHCDDGAIKNLDTVECLDVEKDDWVDGITSLPLPLLGPAITYTC